MVEGIAQPMRTISLPNEELTFEQKLNMIISELDRTIKFFDANNPENTLDPKVPIYISGDLVDKPNVQSSLSQTIKHPVILLTPGLKGTEQAGIQSYCVNTALASKTALPGREATFPLADMNLLPILYQPKPISLVKILGIPGAIAVVALVIPMVLMIQNVSKNIESVQSQLDDTNQKISTQTIQKKTLEKQVTELESRVNGIQTNNTKFEGVVDYLDSQHEQIKGDLIITLGKVNPEITLISITLAEGTLVVQGSAPNNADVYTYAQDILQYARELDSSQRYSETTISSISVLPPPEISDEESGETPFSPETPAEGKIVFILTFLRGGNNMDVIELIHIAKSRGASDLHLAVGTPSMLRINGSIVPAIDEILLTAEDMQQAFDQMTTPDEKTAFQKNLELDFGYSVADLRESPLQRCQAARDYQYGDAPYF